MKESSQTESLPPGLPVPPVQRWLAPVNRFLHIEASSGIVLLVCTVVSLVLANSPWAKEFLGLWKTKVEFTFGSFSLKGDLGHLVINDGLMAIFFFVVGLEIKRELVMGELRDPRKAMLPVFAAIGGMVFPAIIYLVFPFGSPDQRGWAIPMATDIAFVVGFLALFGRAIPFSLKILLLSLAIVDDLGAVLIIAFVFTDQLAWNWLALAALGFVLTYSLNLAGVRQVGVYVVVGVGIWIAVYKSGVHPTVAGVLLGLLTPSSAWIGDRTLRDALFEMWRRVQGKLDRDESYIDDLDKIQFMVREGVSPLQRLENALHPWVAFVIMPVFALANAGVPLEVSALSEPVSLAVASGLALGKPLGIVLMCAVAIALGLARLPDGVTWPLLLGGGCLAGIGFTMALFINGLAFHGDTPEELTLQAAGKIGTLLGSLISAVLGGGVLLFAARRTRATPA